jgi:hypothetical protein
MFVTGNGVLQVGSEQVAYRSQTGFFASTGQVDLNYYPRSNPSGYITAAQAAAQAGGVTSLSVSGSTFSGVLNISGVNGISVISGNSNTIIISGFNTGNFLTNGQTGSLASQGWVDQFYYPRSNPSGYVQNTQTGSFITTGNQQSFVTTVATGIDLQYVSFPFNFPIIPKIVASMEVSSDIMYSMNVRNRSISGYNAIFSDTIQETGVFIHTIATIN